MTIEPLFLDETSNIAHPECFYPGPIEVSHHQLRNFISTVYDGKIFYVNKHDIYILDLDTRQRSLLVTVKFEARCLAAAHGWVCVGGESKGDCAFIHVGEHDGQPGDFCHDLDFKMLGKEIVNAMNIQVLKPDPSDARAKHEVVVLISNNDHTVTIYSLSQRLVLTTVDHPQPMNYAALSPDSTIMAAVGDENKVYFLKRSVVQLSPDPKPDIPYFPEYEWHPLADPDLPCGIPEKEDFSFAIAFSPDGSLCAVSSQGGAITVFDMEAIIQNAPSADDAMICTFRSSRECISGCVRSMSFSPGQWDLLAWAEDHGRIGLADVRQGFQRRQHLALRKQQCKIVDVDDLTPSALQGLGYKERILHQHQQRQRMQALRGHPPVGARFLSSEREPSNAISTLTPRDADQLSERERAMDRALDTALDESVRRPYSVNYISSQPETRPSATNVGPRREYEVQLINPGSRFVSSHIPRRRPSVVLSDSQSSQRLAVDESSRITMTASPGPISDDGMPPPMSTNDLTPASGTGSSQPLPYNIPPSDPWHIIEANLAARRTEGRSSSRLLMAIQQIENAMFLERQLELNMDRQFSDEQGLSNMLRLALNVREQSEQLRLLERQHESQQAQARSAPQRTELVSAQQLSQDLDDCQIRLHQLREMIQNMPRRINQLTDERETLMQQHRNPSASERSSLTSGQSSALPIIFAQTHTGDIDDLLQRMGRERQLLRQQIEGMEREVRRAENDIEVSSLPNTAATPSARSRLQNRAYTREHPSLAINRLLSGAQSGSILPITSDGVGSVPTRSGSSAQYSVLTAARAELRNTISRTSEPETRISQANLHAARLWAQRNSADGNGNWRAASNTQQSNSPSDLSEIQEALRLMGVGTAGIGWSPDGLKL